MQWKCGRCGRSRLACSDYVSAVLPISGESLLTPSGWVDPMPHSVPTLSADIRLPSLLQSCPHCSGSILPRPATTIQLVTLVIDFGALTSVLVLCFLFIIHSLLMQLQDSWLLETLGASCPSPLVASGHF